MMCIKEFFTIYYIISSEKFLFTCIHSFLVVPVEMKGKNPFTFLFIVLIEKYINNKHMRKYITKF